MDGARLVVDEGVSYEYGKDCPFQLLTDLEEPYERNAGLGKCNSSWDGTVIAD